MCCSLVLREGKAELIHLSIFWGLGLLMGFYTSRNASLPSSSF